MYTPLELAEIQKKTLRTLVSGQIIAAASLASAVTVGAFVVQDILVQTLRGVASLAQRSPLERRSWPNC